MDKLTVLETVGPCLTKTYKSDGTTDSYDDAASFHFTQVAVADIHALSRLLGKLHKNRKRCLIRGTPNGESMEAGNIPDTVTRTNANFLDQPLHWFMADIDGYRPGFADPVLEPEQAVLDYIDECLPASFKDCSFYWHLSSSAGMPGKEGILKVHLHFWSKTPYTTAQMAAWVKTTAPTIDRAIFRRVQIHFIADPIFEEGRIDPVPVRCGFHQGATDYVDLVIDEATLAKARDQGSGEGGSDMVLKDPSEKEGLIGAFHKAFTAEDVLLHHLEGFDQVTERRYTWHDGGGTPEGVWVHDDGQHIGSSHNTWPIDGIANLWDVVRVFKFGDLDHREGEEEDFETLGEFQVGSRPSDLAMKAWAAQLPELKEAVVEERATELERLRQLIADAQDTYDLEHVAAAQIRAASLSEMERVILEQAFQARSRAIGVPIRAEQMRRLLRPPFIRNTEAPGWAGEWVWVTENDAFMNTRTKMFVSERSFNAMFDRNMGPFADENGVTPRASAMALNEWGVAVVSRALYAPDFNITFEQNGIEYVNTFRADVMPSVPDKLSKKDLEAIQVIEEHAAMLLPDERERALLLDYLAYCVQFPGRKIRWAPVLKGVEGDGKSAFIQLMGHVLGNQNVRVLDSSTLEKSDFTAWRTGQCFTGIEEMKLHGHNRFDVYNKLKTPLSNDLVEIHPKGRDPYTVPNTTNYMLLTNFDDGVPINDNDRRCMILRTPFLTKEDLEAEMKRRGFEKGKYFERLFDFALKQHAGALRKWLLERTAFHPDFNPNGRAPDTAARDLVVDMSKRDDDDAIETLLETGGLGIYPNLIALQCLNDALFNQYGIKLHTSRAKSILSGYGFTMYSKGQVKWRGANYRFYYRGEKPAHAAVEAERLEKERLNKEIESDFAD